MKKLIFILIASLFLVSCNETDPIEELNPLEGLNLTFLKFYISYLDSEGNDLLDSEHPNGIKEEDIDIYFVIGGEKIRAYNPDNESLPEYFNFLNEAEIDEDFYYYILLFPYPVPDENMRAITFIDIKGYGEDKIEYEFEENGDGYRCAKVWYNDELVWPSEDTHYIFEVLRYFVIEKSLLKY